MLNYGGHWAHGALATLSSVDSVDKAPMSLGFRPVLEEKEALNRMGRVRPFACGSLIPSVLEAKITFGIMYPR